MKKIHMWAAILLLVGGLAHGIPQLYAFLTFGGAPWIQVIVGWASVVVALIMLFKK